MHHPHRCITMVDRLPIVGQYISFAENPNYLPIHLKVCEVVSVKSVTAKELVEGQEVPEGNLAELLAFAVTAEFKNITTVTMKVEGFDMNNNFEQVDIKFSYPDNWSQLYFMEDRPEHKGHYQKKYEEAMEIYFTGIIAEDKYAQQNECWNFLD